MAGSLSTSARAGSVCCALVAAVAAGAGLAAAQAAQAAGDERWVARYHGPDGDGSGYDGARAVTVDGAGGAYVAGYTAGDDHCCKGFITDFATVRYDAAGRQLWARIYDGPAADDDMAQAVAVDGAGNVYVTGYSLGVGTGFDWATVKYDASGALRWVRRHDGPAHGEDHPRALAVDGAGNVYVAGESTDAGEYWGSPDFATIKYDPAGKVLWEARYDGPAPGNGDDSVEALTLDGAGNVYVTGSSRGAAGGWDWATIKYDSAGARQWVTRYDHPYQSEYDADRPVDLAVDAAGNTYVAGIADTGPPYYYNPGGRWYDFGVVKYGPDGGELWTRLYDADDAIGNDEPAGIDLDGSGNVYVAGTSDWSGTYDDYATVKYDPAGNLRWEARYHGLTWSASYDEAVAVQADAAGNVVVAGYSDSLHGYYRYDYATVRYDTAGRELSVARYDGPINGYDEAHDLALDDGGNAYVTGESTGGATEWDFATVKYAAG